MSDHEDVPVLPLDPRPVVLVVDDELTPRSIVTRMVRALGYQARSCPSGAAALRFLQAHPGLVRLVLADLAMPRMDGGELAERIRDRLPGVPIVLMAGAHDAHVEDLIQGYADLPVLPKPISLGEIAELLIDFLGPAPSPDAPSMHRVSARRRRGSGSHRVE